ncbi:hypothetical protein GGX14DRAFT_392870 [Mycena pura]|uniref:Uncharacterized protein n=1 Tax=Mycena pura TaxID=153505 RepID=A0AAD6YDY4_9AGAR|nr:hypothetical protein GGX14DRAFT_392870 [Mycena pura]
MSSDAVDGGWQTVSKKRKSASIGATRAPSTSSSPHLQLSSSTSSSSPATPSRTSRLQLSPHPTPSPPNPVPNLSAGNKGKARSVGPVKSSISHATPPLFSARPTRSPLNSSNDQNVRHPQAGTSSRSHDCSSLGSDLSAKNDVLWSDSPMKIPAIIFVPGGPKSQSHPLDLSELAPELAVAKAAIGKQPAGGKGNRAGHFYLAHKLVGDSIMAWTISSCGETVEEKQQFLNELPPQATRRILPLDSVSRAASILHPMAPQVKILTFNIPNSDQYIHGFLLMAAEATLPVISLKYRASRSFPIKPWQGSYLESYLLLLADEEAEAAGAGGGGPGSDGPGSGGAGGPENGPGGKGGTGDPGNGPGDKDDSGAGAGDEDPEGDTAHGRGGGWSAAARQAAGGRAPSMGAIYDAPADWEVREMYESLMSYAELQGTVFSWMQNRGVWEDPCAPALRPLDVDEEENIDWDFLPPFPDDYPPWPTTDMGVAADTTGIDISFATTLVSSTSDGTLVVGDETLVNDDDSVSCGVCCGHDDVNVFGPTNLEESEDVEDNDSDSERPMDKVLLRTPRLDSIIPLGT